MSCVWIGCCLVCEELRQDKVSDGSLRHNPHFCFVLACSLCAVQSVPFESQAPNAMSIPSSSHAIAPMVSAEINPSSSIYIFIASRRIVMTGINYGRCKHVSGEVHCTGETPPQRHHKWTKMASEHRGTGMMSCLAALSKQNDRYFCDDLNVGHIFHPAWLTRQPGSPTLYPATVLPTTNSGDGNQHA